MTTGRLNPMELLSALVAARSPNPPGDERAVAGALRSVLGTEPGLGVLLGVTDSCWLTEAGIPTLPAFGCGSLAVAHRPNEWIHSDDFATAIDLTEALVRDYTASWRSGAPSADGVRPLA